MVDVFFSVDVEVWCDGWLDIDKKFPAAFRKYIYGTALGAGYGLPYQLAVLNDHGLKGVFFVEPLFSTRFGIEPLSEIIGLIHEKNQEIQLHLHTEWVDEAKQPLLPAIGAKRQHLRYFSKEEQAALVEVGLKQLNRAGAPTITAFRAGSFAFNRDTLSALAKNGIKIDSSYNASYFGIDSGVMPGDPVVEPIECDGVFEYPMTVFHDGTRSLRHAQLTACTYQEMEGLLWQALEERRTSFVILSHSSELLNRAKNRPDNVVVRRFHKLCSFLERNRDCFHVRGFQGLQPRAVPQQPGPLSSPLWKTGGRLLEQAYRRIYR